MTFSIDNTTIGIDSVFMTKLPQLTPIKLYLLNKFSSFVENPPSGPIAISKVENLFILPI